MRGISSATGTYSSLSAGTADRNRSGGLLRDAGRADLHPLAGSPHRSFQPREIEARIRQHTVLAQLVRSIEPETADALASELLRAFGTLGRIFAASQAAISQVIDSQILATVLSSARFAVLESLREEVRGAAFDIRDERFLTYLVAKMQGIAEEQLHAIFLDHRRHYIADELFAEGTWDQISFRLRPLLRRALELNAASVVLFHNHPSGNAAASAKDREFTRKAAAIARTLDIALLDHLIVAGPRVHSMRAAGEL